MMLSPHLRRMSALLLIAALLAFPLASALAQGDSEPVTFYLPAGTNVSSLDPQVATDTVSISLIENLFLGLTDVDAQTTEIVSELASAWRYDAETFTWTFTIRDDVPWVRWDAVTEEAVALRSVTAGDFVTGIRRACDPNNTSLYSEVTASVIAGCDEVFSMNPADVTEADFQQVQVAAPDDTTLTITLRGSVGHFFSMTPMWMLRAVPGEIIAEYGDQWTEAGNIVTNGPFLLDEWVRGVRRVLIRNPYLPEDLAGPGNVERVIQSVIEDGGTIYALYQDSQIDQSFVPTAELQNVLNDPARSQEVRQVVSLAVFYFGYAHDKPPFDDVHVRRAFSAAVNREVFVSELLQNLGVPMMHFTPPGMFGAVPLNEVGINGEGIGFDPAFAQEEIAAAGYPNCQDFPNINVITYQGAASWAEFVSAELQANLGCDPGLFTIEQLEFTVLLQVTQRSNPTAERPHMWTLGWAPDYPDANNWVFDAGLHCESSNDYARPCSEVDDLIYDAQEEIDPERRAELYATIEEMFFGYEGEHPMMPLFMDVGYVAIKPWVERPIETDGLFGGVHYDWVTIDAAMQQEARGG